MNIEEGNDVWVRSELMEKYNLPISPLCVRIVSKSIEDLLQSNPLTCSCLLCLPNNPIGLKRKRSLFSYCNNLSQLSGQFQFHKTTHVLGFGANPNTSSRLESEFLNFPPAIRKRLFLRVSELQNRTQSSSNLRIFRVKF